MNTVSEGHRSPKILVLNLHSFNNPGDAALTIVSVRHLRRNFPNCEITLAMHDVESYVGSEIVVQSFNSHFKSFPKERGIKWQFGTLIWLPFASLLTSLVFRIFHKKIYFFINQSQKKLISAYLKSDLILSAPGNYFFSSGFIGLPFAISVFSLILGIILDKPIYLLPQSVGPIKRARERILLKWTLSKCNLVMLREPLSFNTIQDFNLPKGQYLLFPDLAFDYSDTSPDEAQRWLSSHGIQSGDPKPLLGITSIDLPQKIRNPNHQKRYETAIAEAVSRFIKQYGGKAVFFTHVSGSPYVANDQISAERIASLIPERSSSIIVIEETLKTSIHKSAYGVMDIFLGTRMHSNIFAMVEGVPSLAIAYFPKTRGIMEMLGLSRWTIDVEDINASLLYERLEELWKHRRSLEKELEPKISQAAREATKALDLIAKDFRYSLRRKQKHD